MRTVTITIKKTLFLALMVCEKDKMLSLKWNCKFKSQTHRKNTE